MTIRRHAGFNPMAQYRDPITVDDVLVVDAWWPTRCTCSTAAWCPTEAARASLPPRSGPRDLPSRPGARARRGARHQPRPQRLAVGGPDGDRRRPARARWALASSRRRRSPTSTCCSSTTRSPSRCCSRSRTSASARRARAVAFVEGGRLAFDGPLPDQHRRRRPVGLPPGHARHVPDRRGGAPAAGRGRARPRCPARRWRSSHGTGGMLSTGATVVLGTERHEP